MQKCKECKNQNKVRKEGKKYYKCEEKIKKHKSSNYTKYAKQETLVKQTINTENAKHAKKKTYKAY